MKCPIKAGLLSVARIRNFSCPIYCSAHFAGLTLGCVASYPTLSNANIFEMLKKGKFNEKSGKKVAEKVQTAARRETACLQEG